MIISFIDFVSKIFLFIQTADSDLIDVEIKSLFGSTYTYLGGNVDQSGSQVLSDVWKGDGGPAKRGSHCQIWQRAF